MSWFKKEKTPLSQGGKKRGGVPEGLFLKCEGCGEMVYAGEFEAAWRVCKKCGKHHTLPSRRRILLLIDENTFNEQDVAIQALDTLKFRDTKKYRDRIKSAQKESGEYDAIVCGGGKLNGWEVEIAAFEFGFMGGSMGVVVGEKITRAAERARKRKCPLIVVSCSGGARMQEGTFSLMQMAKTSAAIAEMNEAGLPYFSVLAHPTAGGVTASFAMLGDVIIAEPDALICFAGPRVIEQTIRQKLPEGFQRSEFLLEHGFVDVIVKRDELKNTLTTFIKHMSTKIPDHNRPPKPAEEKQA
ncbi:MAG: acetyl-CoA carboxylase carboxyltransferase subunit beta [Nitrospinae bacterium]|nr:acetyl-CoA carboxylase carboxyltransferase subunit beta [Nitrospinota bacterium]